MPQGTQELLSSKICESFEDRKKEILILLWEVIFLKYSCDPGWIFFLIQNQRIQGYGTWFRGYRRIHRRRKTCLFSLVLFLLPLDHLFQRGGCLGSLLPSLSGDGQESPSFRSACACTLHFAVLPHRCNKVPYFCSSVTLLNFSCGLDCRWAFPALLVLVVINSAVVSNIVCIALAISYLNLLKTWTRDMFYPGYSINLFPLVYKSSLHIEELGPFYGMTYSICPLSFYFV